MVTQAPETSPTERAQRFIEWVKAGRNPPTSEPLTPEIAAAVEASMDNQDEANRAKIRDALNALRATAKPPEWNEGSLSSLFEWAQSDLMKWAPKLLDAIIDPQLNEWKSATGVKLTGEQKMNIKLAIIDRIVSGAASEALFGSLKSKLNAVSEKFSKVDIKNLSLDSLDSLTKEFSLSGDDEAKGSADSGMEGTIKKQIEKILSETLGQIRGAYETNPQPIGFTDLLMHPKALADYKSGEDIPTLLARSGNASLTRLAYQEGIKQKILSLEWSILSAENTKNKVMDFLTKLPDFAADKLFGAFEWLFKMPIIGDLIATFFGYKSGKTLIDDLKIETKERKSMLALMEYGMKKNESKTLEKWGENGKIKLLENIDFTDIQYKNLKSFYTLMKENKIDTTAKDFWKTVFGEGKIEIGEEGKKKTITFPKWDPRIDTTAEKIVAKLNTTGVTMVSPAPAAAVPTSTPAPNPSGGSQTLPPVVWWDAVPSTPPAVVTTQGAPWAPAVAAVSATSVSVAKETREVILPYEQALEKSFMGAIRFPFTFTHTTWTETVDAKGNILIIGSRQFTLSAKFWFDIPAKWISLSQDTVTLVFPGLMSDTVVPKPKTDFAPHIQKLLTYIQNERKEIATTDPKTGKVDTLIITRTA